jgi:multicomponent Na+:H+ antiporter subunit D
MGFMAFLCIFLGVYPRPLYSILPFGEVHYQAYTFAHVLTQLQLLMLSALVFFLFLPLLKRTETISLDTDWFYRKGGRLLYRLADAVFNQINRLCDQYIAGELTLAINRFCRNAPVRISWWLLMPFYRLGKHSAEHSRRYAQTIQAALENGIVPIGLSAAVSGLFLLLLFFLN